MNKGSDPLIALPSCMTKQIFEIRRHFLDTIEFLATKYK